MADDVEVRLPKLGLQMSDAVVLRWLRGEGDRVSEGEPLLEIETGKTTATVSAPATGTLGPLRVQPDEEVAVGAVLATIEPAGG